MPEPTPEMIAMAREVMKNARDCTDVEAMIVAAIQATTEKAAAYIESHVYSTTGSETQMEPSRFAMNDRHHATIASYLRKSAHLKEQPQ